jgi:hypothetical protein|nr:MAG TPA: DNA-directed RNA polymerase II subunit [Caudoviricetes sp.]
MIDNCNILIEYGYLQDSDPLDRFFESIDQDPDWTRLDEATYQDRANNAVLQLEVLDVPLYIKQNELKEITNPTFFSPSGAPTSDGLLSNEIFGMTQKERSGIYAYIDLAEYFIDPSCWKTLTKLDSKFKGIINGINKYIITPDGELVEDETGNTGIKWLKQNFGKIKFKKTDSRTRDMRIKYIMHNYNKGRMFINKYIVIPPYYRDVNTTGKHTGVGQINTFYVNLLTAARALKENNDYGLSMADTTCYRIQNTLKAIYDWFCGNSNSDIKDKGSGLGGKFGLIRANMGYTSDYSSRLVLSAPNLNTNSVDDLMVTIDKSAIPLAAVAADFYPFMMFHIRKFFENELQNATSYEFVNDNGEQVSIALADDPMAYFNDDMIKDHLKKFVYSHDTRFIPVELPTKNTDHTYYMTFKGKRWDSVKDAELSPEPTLQRPLTWVDVIYVAAIRATDGKQISFTRYPYDSYFNTIYTGIEVATTKETEPIMLNGELYKFYPKIRLEDINAPSAQKFIDTMQISNLYLNGMGADYDGDMGQVKGSFFNETNQELANFTNSKANFINMACTNIRVSEKEAVQSLYNMTLVLRDDVSKLTDPKF